MMPPRTRFNLFVFTFLALTGLAVGAAETSVPAPAPAAATAPAVPLWNGSAPGALGDTPEDIPTLTRFAPETGKANGASLLILPGGGYGHLAKHEGAGYATWFSAQGITCYVLQYRLGSRGYRHPVMLQDAARALRTVRAAARRDGLDPARVGIVGSSAGGHLASTLLTHFDSGQTDSADPVERESSRPDLGILCYAVITLGEFTHQGSKLNLLGANPVPELVELLSNEKQVTAQTPPCFLWHTADDATVPVENSLQFASALRRAGVPFDLHIYQHGKHGLGLPTAANHGPPWDQDCLFWLRARNFIP
jgi:acetyl esterase/lipase